jgi:PLP dependent protein
MKTIAENILELKAQLPETVKLIAVSKTKPVSAILDAYQAGQRVFGENKVQELVAKYEALPKDIEWHMIGHLQTNKVKYLVSFVGLIHGVDSLSLIKEINKQAKKIGRIQKILLQFHIAQEDTKFGFSFQEVTAMLESDEFRAFESTEVVGVMGMASFTSDTLQIHREFASLKILL